MKETPAHPPESPFENSTPIFLPMRIMINRARFFLLALFLTVGCKRPEPPLLTIPFSDAVSTRVRDWRTYPPREIEITDQKTLAKLSAFFGQGRELSAFYGQGRVLPKNVCIIGAGTFSVYLVRTDGSSVQILILGSIWESSWDKNSLTRGPVNNGFSAFVSTLVSPNSTPTFQPSVVPDSNSAAPTNPAMPAISPVSLPSPPK